jgi:hypothetical protein
MSRYLSVLLGILLLAGCANPPKTADEAYRRCRVVPQPSGGKLVVGPEIPFTVRGTRGITSFQALIEPHQIHYYQMTSLGTQEDAGTFEASRARMEQFRKTGASLAVVGSSISVRFSPQYVDGFLRRVDAVAAQH